MTDIPFLIAHKVRSEPAFDIAIKQTCAICRAEDIYACDECDNQGFWWICSTSGHRAYPYWSIEVSRLQNGGLLIVEDLCPQMPEGIPDHYRVNASPKPLRDAGRSLLAKLGLGRSATPIKRRI